MTTSTTASPVTATHETELKLLSPDETMAQSARLSSERAAAAAKPIMDAAKTKHAEDEQVEASMLEQARRSAGGRANT